MESRDLTIKIWFRLLFNSVLVGADEERRAWPRDIKVTVHKGGLTEASLVIYTDDLEQLWNWW